MDDHKLVMISIFFYFQNMRKMQSFNENMREIFLGFGRMKTKYFFFFLKGKLI